MECFPLEETAGATSSIWHGGHPLDFSFSLIAVQFLCIMIVTWALRFILKPLKQPRVVSEILGGILLGPSGLGRNVTFRRMVFPKKGKPVLDTISSFGLMYVIFIIGVKMDAGMMKRAGTKPIVIGLISFFVPFSFMITYCLLGGPLPLGVDNRFVFLFSIATSLSVTSFANLVPILSDLNLLNSELGQIVMTATMTNDAIGWAFIMAFVVLDASYVSIANSIWAICSIAALVLFIVFVVRPMAVWVVENTLPGKPVDEGYVFVFFLVVLVVGFVGDVIGTNSFHGALLLGLAIPEGPPLGATLVEKTEHFVNGILLPLYYVLLGLNTDVSTIYDWNGTVMLMLLALLGNLVGVLLPSLYLKIPIRESLSLSLFLNSKGIVEMVTYNLWRSSKLVDEQTYTVLVLSTVTLTSFVVPIATVLYEPSRRYTVFKRRTVEHHKAGTEMRILACVHDEARVPGIINLLEASHGAAESPIAIYALHLVELVGRAAPVFIPHKLTSGDNHTQHVAESEHIANVFLHFERRHRNKIPVYPFTTISPYASMHDEICRLAVDKRTSIIVLPYHRGLTANGLPEVNNGLRTVNRHVLASAPCSVGILVDAPAGGGAMGPISGEFAHQVGVFFFGGVDDREALAWGALMAAHPGVGVTMVRFLPSRSIRDDQTERKLDGWAVDKFRINCKRNERVAYREALVRDLEEIVEVIRVMIEEKCFDLVLVGMRHLSNSVISESFSEWIDCPELGEMGDILASSDFNANFSILVIKQQDESGLHPPQSSCKGGSIAAEETLQPLAERTSGPIER